MANGYIKAPRTRNLSNYQPEFKFEGDWAQVLWLTQGAAATISEGAILGQLSAGKKMEKIVKRHIRENGARIGWPLLSSETQEKKASMGFNADRMYYMTGTYYWNIKTWRLGDKVYTGIKKGIRHPINTHITIGQIANILEYGAQSRGIPPRPLWAPSFKDLGGAKRVRGLILWHIKNQFRINHGINPKITF